MEANLEGVISGELVPQEPERSSASMVIVALLVQWLIVLGVVIGRPG